MDPFTHAALGACLGYVGWGARIGGNAVIIGGLAALAPDLDFFIRSAADPLLYAEQHRGFTHSFLFSLAGATVVGLPWYWRERFKILRGEVWKCAWVGWLSHVLLDASTTYGTQILWPFSPHRAAWNLIAIVDPLFTLALVAGLLGAWSSGLRRHAALGLGLALVYLGFGFKIRLDAAAVQAQLAAQRGHTPRRATVMPTLGNNVIWRSLYEADGRCYSDRIRISWTGTRTVCPGTSVPALTAAGLSPLEATRNRTTRAFDRFAWFSDQWMARATDDPKVIGDLRYSLTTDKFSPVWGMRFTTNTSGAPYEWIDHAGERRVSPAELWADIAGSNPCFKPLSKDPRPGG